MNYLTQNINNEHMMQSCASTIENSYISSTFSWENNDQELKSTL